MTAAELEILKSLGIAPPEEPQYQRTVDTLPVQEPPMAPPVKPPSYDYDTRADQYRTQASDLEKQASAPMARPAGVKEHLVSAARSFMEGMARPSDPYAEERRREDIHRSEQDKLVERARALRGQAGQEEQMGETAQLRAQQKQKMDFDINQAEAAAKRDKYLVTAQGGIAEIPASGTGAPSFYHDPAYQGPSDSTTDIKNYNVAVKQGFKGTLQDWIKAAHPVNPPSGATVQYTDPEGNLRVGVRQGSSLTPLKINGQEVQGATIGRELGKADIETVKDAATAQNLYNRMQSTVQRVESGKSTAVGADDEALLAMHLSMTMGQVKGARTSRDVIDAHRNAIDPASRLGRAIENVRTGAGLTPDQRHEFVDLARRQVENMRQKRQDLHDFYSEYPNNQSVTAPTVQQAQKPRIRIN
jgi:hypothetical protein